MVIQTIIFVKYSLIRFVCLAVFFIVRFLKFLFAYLFIYFVLPHKTVKQSCIDRSKAPACLSSAVDVVRDGGGGGVV